jgi:hypothetical protein
MSRSDGDRVTEEHLTQANVQGGPCSLRIWVTTWGIPRVVIFEPTSRTVLAEVTSTL